VIDPRNPGFVRDPASPSHAGYEYRPLRPTAKPVVSIITPFDRPGPEFLDTARSVFEQSLQQWEWIVIDDGATDPQSSETLENCGDKDPRVRIVRHASKRGLQAALNTGCEEAQTDYLFLLASGALLSPTALETCLWFLVSHRNFALADANAMETGEEPTPRPVASLLGDKPAAAAAMVRRDVYMAAIASGEEPPEEFREDTPEHRMPYDAVAEDLPCENRLRKSKRRLLMLLPWMNVGGADKFNLDLLGQLSHADWEVTIATTAPGTNAWQPEFARHTPDIFILPNYLRVRDYARFLKYLILSRAIGTVLITNSLFGYQVLPYLRSEFPDVTFVDYCHMEESWIGGGYPNDAVEYQLLLDLNIVSSQHLKEWMVDRGAHADRICVCHTNIDTDYWRPDPATRRRVRSELQIDDNVPIVLYCGRIVAQKQPRVFAESARLAASGQEPFVCVVAGDGPELPWLSEFVQKHEIGERIRLLGEVENERVRELLTAADLFFLPSQHEGIALSIYEAMSCGVAVLGADVGGQRELVTPECGVLLPRSDPNAEAQAYAAALRQLLGDPDRLKSMGRAGRERVSRHFRLENMGSRMIELLDRAREIHRSQPRPEVHRLFGRLAAWHAMELERRVELIEERDKWYRQVLALGDELQALRDELPSLSSNIFVRLWRKLRLRRPP